MTELYKLLSLETQKPIWGLEDAYFKDWGYLIKNAEEVCRAKKVKDKYILFNFASEQALIDVVKYIHTKDDLFAIAHINPMTYFLLWDIKREVIDEAKAKYNFDYILPPCASLEKTTMRDALMGSEIHLPKIPKPFKVYYPFYSDFWGEVYLSKLRFIGLYNKGKKYAFSFYSVSMFTYFASEAYKASKDTYIVCDKKLISAKEAKFITDTIGLTITRR